MAKWVRISTNVVGTHIKHVTCVDVFFLSEGVAPFDLPEWVGGGEQGNRGRGNGCGEG